MSRFVKGFTALMLAVALAACGGGGGSAGSTGATTGGGTGTGTGTGSTTAQANVALSLVNGSGAAVAGNAVSSGTPTFLRAVVKDATGATVANKLVSFTSAGGIVSFQPASGTVLTDSSGVATVQVAPTSVNSAGADTVTASATVGTTPVSASLDVQTAAANVSLSGLAAAQTSLTSVQNTGVTVNVATNGAPATTPVSVTFAASCGSFSPTSVASDSTGKASSTFSANGCTGGNVTLTASASGANSVSTTVAVQTPQATNLLFVSATPSTIFTSAASSGDKQSTVRFRVVDAAGNPIAAATQVQVSLSSAAIAAGVTFADTNTTTPKVVSTDANGEVAVIVKSGGFPTPLSLTATLVSNSTVTASSSGLAVNSGRAVQKFLSLSASTLNIEGGQFDGIPTTLTIRAADRLGQPVPAGTPVSFITEGGQIVASCTLSLDANNTSGCSVTLQSQAFRPQDGRVTVLAFMDGDEAFTDLNGNNRYDQGEPFVDQGQPFLDFNENGVLDVNEQKVGDASVPGSGIGSSTCPAQIANVPNTCDGAWGPTRIRAQIVIVFSESAADPTGAIGNVTGTSADVTVRDSLGNPLPAGTQVNATVAGGNNCTVTSVTPNTVGNAVAPTTHRVVVNASGNGTCSGATLNVSTTTPRGITTLFPSVTIP